MWSVSEAIESNIKVFLLMWESAVTSCWIMTVLQVMIQILKDMGITEYEPRVINQMLEFTYSEWRRFEPITRLFLSPRSVVNITSLPLFTGYVTTIIEDAKIYATHAKKSTVDADDIKLAIQCRMDQSFTSPPPRDVRRPLSCNIQRQQTRLLRLF